VSLLEDPRQPLPTFAVGCACDPEPEEDITFTSVALPENITHHRVTVLGIVLLIGSIMLGRTFCVACDVGAAGTLNTPENITYH
jgi:hypothetical protein